MSGLQRFEQRLEQAISGVFARTFRSAVQPVEIAAALERECDNNAQILSRQRRLVPNAFYVELSRTDHDRLSGFDSTLARELITQVKDHADDQGYVFPGPVKLSFEATDDLTTGRFRIRSKAEARVEGSASHTQVRRARAFLDINGTHHPLQPPRLVVGRGSDADVRIDDPGISRRHAEFLISLGRDDDGRAGEGEAHVEVHDLGSTNGIKVDGRKIPHATLRDGSQVQVGHTTVTLRIVEDGANV